MQFFFQVTNATNILLRKSRPKCCPIAYVKNFVTLIFRENNGPKIWPFYANFGKILSPKKYVQLAKNS
jgi:hypothetical protein